MPFERFLLERVIILTAAKIGSEIAERFNQPTFLGELSAGIVVGISVFGQFAAVPGLQRPAHLAADPHAGFLVVAAVIGKTVAELSIPKRGVARWLIGGGMVPRGYENQDISPRLGRQPQPGRPNPMLAADANR